MTNFSAISKQYEKDSIIQKSASEVLFDLLDIQSNDNVLDLGCGTGHIASSIRAMAGGKVVGVDPSEGMIKQAKEKYADQDITFLRRSAEELNYADEFDVIFCNSVFQWFTNPMPALRACYAALKNEGRMAIQAPARDDYCPNFIEAIDNVRNNRNTKDIFAGFTSPWLFFNTAEEYAALFEDAGFKVMESTIDTVVTSHSPEEVFTIFASGAAAGYLNQEYYKTKITEDYVASFRTVVQESFRNQANNKGKVKLIFYRIYLLARK